MRMSKSSRLGRIALLWRKACAAFPAVALIAGVALMAQADLERKLEAGAISNSSPAIVVPDFALTMPADPRRFSADPLDMASPSRPPGSQRQVRVVGTSAPALSLGNSFTEPWHIFEGKDMTRHGQLKYGRSGISTAARTPVSRTGEDTTAVQVAIDW